MNQIEGPAARIPAPPPLLRVSGWDQNVIRRPLIVGTIPSGNNRDITAPNADKTEWSEREHLHNMINTLTIENVDLKSQRLVKDKLVENLDRQVKAADQHNGHVNQQLVIAATGGKEQTAKEVVSLTSNIAVIKPAALEWSSTEVRKNVSAPHHANAPRVDCPLNY